MLLRRERGSSRRPKRIPGGQPRPVSDGSRTRRALLRIYLPPRNANNQSQIVYADFDPRHDMRLLRFATEPLLDLGAPGQFRQCRNGAERGAVVGARVFLYYVGFSLRRDVPHQQAIASRSVRTAAPASAAPRRGPVLSTGPFDRYSPRCRIVAQRGDAFEMHYMSGTAWPRHGDRSTRNT